MIDFSCCFLWFFRLKIYGQGFKPLKSDGCIYPFSVKRHFAKMPENRLFWQGQKDKAASHLSCLATKSDAFGTRLRICFAKNSSPNCFFTLAAPLGFKSFCFDTKKESNYLWQPLSFLAPTVGLEPTSVCNINSTASHKATGFIVLRHNPPRSLLPPPAAVENIPV